MRVPQDPELDLAVRCAWLSFIGGRTHEEIGAVGFGHGRTLAAAVNGLPLLQRPGLKLVSLLGSLTRGAATNPYDVIFRLADRTGGTGYYVPAPFFCNSETDRAVFVAQREVRAVLDLASQAEVMVVGIGAPDRDRGMIDAGMVTLPERDALEDAHAAGEILGTFVDANGQVLDVEINRRAIAPRLDDLRGKEVVAIAGGPNKVDAIDAVLRAGIVTHLVTDEQTARALAGRQPTTTKRAEPAQGGIDVEQGHGPRPKLRSRPRQPA